MANFIYIILDSLIGLIMLAIVISAIMSWLVAFNVVNPRNDFVRMMLRFLEAVTRPFLWPVQRFIPPLGGVDVSPIIVLIILYAVRVALLPWIFRPLVSTIG